MIRTHQTIRKAITLFSGFTEGRGSYGSGIVDIYETTRRQAKPHEDTLVSQFKWDEDIHDVAEGVWSKAPEKVRQKHLVMGYSYGGQAAINFCRALIDRGNVNIVDLWLIDPVRRGILPGFAALFGFGRLFVDREVNHVENWYQDHWRWSLQRGFKDGITKTYLPAGHKVMHRGKRVVGNWRTQNHLHIDNDQDIASRFERRVDQFLEA